MKAGADVVEFNPSQDPGDIPAPLCAKLVKKLAERMLRTRPGATAGPR